VRLRIKYTKTGPAAYLGHLEMLRLWQRAIRRAGLPLMMSHGFNPHPQLAFGPALAVGIVSQGEYLDMDLATALAPDEVKQRLQAELPAGLELLLVAAISDQAPALTAVIDTAAYRVSWLQPLDAATLQPKADALLARPVIEVSRAGKAGVRVKDIRPGLWRITVNADASLELLLECSSRGAVRPEEVLDAMGLDAPRSITRTGLFIRRGDALLAPEDYQDSPGQV